MVKNLLIGGFGFLGAQIARELLGRGEEVAVFDVYAPPATVADFAPRIRFMRGDITNWSHLAKTWLELQPENVFCLPAIMPPASEQDPALAFQINVQGTFNVLETCRLIPVKRLLMISSISVYAPGVPPVVSDDFPQCPWSMYGVSKVCLERLGEQYARRYGVDFRALRLPGVLGPGRLGQAQSSFANYAISHALASRPYTINVTPETRLLMLYVRDAVRAFLTLRDAPAEKLGQRVYNINGFFFSVAELVAAIRESFPGAAYSFVPDPAVVRVIEGWPQAMDDSTAQRDWGWRPDYDIRSAVKDYIVELGTYPERYPR